MRKTIYQNEKIKVKYETYPHALFGNYCLYYDKYKLPLALEGAVEMTAEQAEHLVKIIEPALDRLYLVAGADGLTAGREQGKKQLQNDLKKLLGITGAQK